MRFFFGRIWKSDENFAGQTDLEENFKKILHFFLIHKFFDTSVRRDSRHDAQLFSADH